MDEFLRLIPGVAAVGRKTGQERNGDRNLEGVSEARSKSVSPRHSRVVNQRSFSAQGSNVVRSRGHAAESEFLGNLPQAGRDAKRSLPQLNEIKNLFLPRS